MGKNLKKKRKKGFTLIELVIVLAVLAIIALIAIPNFTKVRNDSLAKADTETMNQIEKITLMAIASDYIKPPTSGTGTIYKVGKGVLQNNSNADISGANQEFKDMLKEISDAQVNGKKLFKVTVTTGSDVIVTYSN